MTITSPPVYLNLFKWILFFFAAKYGETLRESLTNESLVSAKVGTCCLCDSLSLVFFFKKQIDSVYSTLPLQHCQLLSPSRKTAASSTQQWTSELTTGPQRWTGGSTKRRREPLTPPGAQSMMGKWSIPRWQSTSKLSLSLTL